jgi:cell division protein FtsL
MTWQDFIKSRIATWGLAIALLFVLTITAKVLIQKYQVDQEIAKLEKQVQKVKQVFSKKQ